MKRSIRRVISLGALVALVAVPTMLPALAQSGSAATPTRVQHRQSVLTQVSPTGAFDSAIVVTQLLVSGNGTVEVSLPNQATAGLRNLEGFDRPSVSGSDVTWRIPTSPAGALRRTVADADTSVVPVSMEIVYELDGEVVTPSQLVGRTGFLTVTYTVTNLTAEEREVRYFDGQGRPRTGTVEVAVPMGGTFSTTLDSRFVNVESAQATAIAGDGQGNTVVNGSYTLFAPAGESTQSFAWSAYVTDAIVPAAEITILPVSSRSSQAVSSGQAQLEQLINGFKDITNGGLIINSNLLRLSDGAQSLAEGLSGKAAPGARQLADGLAKTAAPGAKQLADGLATAAAGAPVLADGAKQVADGIKEVRGEVYGAKGAACDRTSILVGANALGGSFGSNPPFDAQVAATVAAVLPGAALQQVTAWSQLASTAGPPAVDNPLEGTSAGHPLFDAYVTGLQSNPTFVGAVTVRVVQQLAVGAVAQQAFPECKSVVETLKLLNAMVDGAAPLESLGNQLADNVTAGIITKLEDKKADIKKLGEGAYAVADGAQRVSDGLNESAAPGAKLLADGLKGAADGAGELADGIGDAADGATLVAGGTVALSEAIEGSLIGGTTEAGADLGLTLAQLNAADSRGIDNEGLPYGTVANADVTAVYAFQIAGIGGDAGASSSALALAALAALALAALLGLAVRSRLG